MAELLSLSESITRALKGANRIEHWDDERGSGNGIIVTLQWGWSFEPHGCGHEGVRGFDTPREAKAAVKYAWPCWCDDCMRNIARAYDERE